MRRAAQEPVVAAGDCTCCWLTATARHAGRVGMCWLAGAGDGRAHCEPGARAARRREGRSNERGRRDGRGARPVWTTAAVLNAHRAVRLVHAAPACGPACISPRSTRSVDWYADTRAITAHRMQRADSHESRAPAALLASTTAPLALHSAVVHAATATTAAMRLATVPAPTRPLLSHLCHRRHQQLRSLPSSPPSASSLPVTALLSSPFTCHCPFAAGHLSSSDSPLSHDVQPSVESSVFGEGPQQHLA